MTYEEKKAKWREWYAKNKDAYNLKRKNWLKTKPLFAISRTAQSRICLALKTQGVKRTLDYYDMIGCSYKDLKKYIESKFINGMTWENRGGKYGWQLDHIIPCSMFDLSKEEEQLKCFNYTNLQPLFLRDHHKKGYKVVKHKPSNELAVAFLKIDRLEAENHKLKDYINNYCQKAIK